MEDQLVILTSWEKRDVSKEFRQPLNAFLAYEYAMLLPSYGSLSRREKKLYCQEVRRCAYLLRYGKSRKLRLIRSTTKVFGIDLTARILSAYIRWRSKRYGKS